MYYYLRQDGIYFVNRIDVANFHLDNVYYLLQSHLLGLISFVIHKEKCIPHRKSNYTDVRKG